MNYKVLKDIMEVAKNGHNYKDGSYQLDMIDFMNGTPLLLGTFEDSDMAIEFAKKQSMWQQDLGKNMRYEFVYVEEYDDDDEPTGSYLDFFVPGE
jgi:hypothetical protein